VREAQAEYQAAANDAPEVREKAMDRLLAAQKMVDVAGAA
jgi:F-type H+-transporting ATPase subunit epsilon